MRELILSGGKSGKPRCAESRAKDWLQVSGPHALLIATAMPGDHEMCERIARHREQRALHAPTLQAVEVPHDLPAALREWRTPHRLLIVDCLTLWLTQRLMPLDGPPLDTPQWLQQLADLCAALHEVAGPVVLVSNEIGMSVAPQGREVRRYLDALGTLHQRVAALCERVTLTVAGIEMRVKA